MRSIDSPYGRIEIGDTPEILAAAAALIRQTAEAGNASRPTSVALSGGSTPKALYQWIVENRALPRSATVHLVWTVSDERTVPPSSPESNLGNLDRQLLVPLEIAANAKLSWPVDLPPDQAAAMYASLWQERVADDRLYDLCFLGMGDDGHTLSIFPDSPLLKRPVSGDVAAVEVPEKGWRLTATPSGLKRCGQIVALVAGAGKVARIRSVFQGPHDPITQPIQLLKDHANRVVWLMDEAAAAGLTD
ncbi:MAG: 6-phosphogluconolactonase [Opitutales bacterium]